MSDSQPQPAAAERDTATENGQTDLALMDPSILQSGAVLSGLLAAVAATLLTFFKDDSKFTHRQSASRDAILTLNYISLIFSIFATATSVALTVGHTWGWSKASGSSYFSVQAFKSWVLLLFLASAFAVASVFAYIALEEERNIQIAVGVVAGLYSFCLVFYTSEMLAEGWERKKAKWKKPKVENGMAAKEV